MDDLCGTVWRTGHLKRGTRRAKCALVVAVFVLGDIYLALSRFGRGGNAGAGADLCVRVEGRCS